MEKANYTVKKNNIYAGILEKFEEQVIVTFEQDYGETQYNSYWKPCRTVLFTIDENNMAIDLLYDTNPCPIEGITPENAVEKIDSVVFHPLSMRTILDYFRYPEDLDLSDIQSIKTRFFSPDFFKENCYLFGYKELNVKDLINMGVFDAKNPIEEDYFDRLYQKLREKGLEKYKYVASGETELPQEYFGKLKLLAGRPINGSEKNIRIRKDVFKPRITKEGHVKKLVKQHKKAL